MSVQDEINQNINRKKCLRSKIPINQRTLSMLFGCFLFKRSVLKLLLLTVKKQ